MARSWTMKYAGVNPEPRVSGRATAVCRCCSKPSSRISGSEWTSTPLGRLWDPGLPLSGCATPQARHGKSFLLFSTCFELFHDRQKLAHVTVF
ncbi:uncharacterized protein NPIL_112861 [Nephila pilipes]|uniref:Uncharacterized protein n=1 Tax=Nephila pilipes TaxID=299642 RepID=A0A8X6Q4J0_NEPPI|nr:uncharacterized protein NPIL_112861 [Nephila pilipes]